MKKQLPKIATVLLNYNGKQDTIECLQSLFTVDTTGFTTQMILVDNGSTDGSIPAFKKFLSQNKKIPVRLIENKENLGFADGNNVGIREALKDGTDYFLILNNDTLVEKNLLARLLETAQKHPEVGITGPKIYFAPGFEYHYDRYKEKDRGKVIWYAGGIIDWPNLLFSHRGVDETDNGQYDTAGETDFISGCALFIKKEVLEKIGFFDPKYFLYLEDVDLCQRAKMAGFKIQYEPKAILWHKNASSSDKPGSDIHVYYQTRNRLLFGFLYAQPRIKLALLREAFKTVWQGGVRRRAVLDFFLGKLGKGSM